jgi:hypothetical protein
MVIAGWATGATEGYLYIRSEYPDAIDTMQAAIAQCEALGWLTVLRATRCWAASSTSGCTFEWARAPTSVAKRRR